MFEGETTIKFSKEASKLIMSQNMSSMFGMPLEVTELDYGYDGLKITFQPPQESAKAAKASEFMGGTEPPDEQGEGKDADV